MTKKKNEDFIEKRLQDIKSCTLIGVKNMLTLDEVCMFMGMSKNYVYQLTSKGVLPFYKPNGRMLYFDKSEIEAWLKQNYHGTLQEAEQKAVAYMAERGSA